MRRHSQEWNSSFAATTIINHHTWENNDSADHEDMVFVEDTSQSETATTRSSSSATLMTTTPAKTRRSTFSLALPWRPSSHYEFHSHGSVGQPPLSPHSPTSSSFPKPSAATSTTAVTTATSMTTAQRRFVNAFPELADLMDVPMGLCAPCLATPPQTPPESMSPSRTLQSLSMSDHSSTSSSSSSTSVSASEHGSRSCPGHLNEFMCALHDEPETPWQGTLYVMATHVCFWGKNNGQVVRFVVDYRDLVAIETERKVGLFRNEIRLRANISITSTSASQEPTPQKEYLLTSFMNWEQALGEMERNWIVYRQVVQYLGNHHRHHHHHHSIAQENTDPSSLNHATSQQRQPLEPKGTGSQSPMQSGNLRARRRVTRAYSVASNSTYSSPEGISRPAPSDCRVAPAATEWNEGGVGSTIWRPQATSAQTNAALHAILDKHDHYNRDSTVPGSGTRRGSHSTLSSRAITAVIGMKQRQQEHGESSSSDDTSIRPGCKLASRSIRSVNSSDEGHERSSVQDLTTAAAPIPIQNSTGAGAGTGSGSIQRPKLFKSPTPPPSLLSPSLTTTKVSHSSSTVHGVTPRQGGSAGMVVHVRKESGEKNFDEEDMTTEVQAKQTSTVFSSGASQRSFVSTITDLPNTTGSPDMIVAVASCGCERHYKHAILSTVVPIPLEKCFELLFSGQGAGLGNELMVETKRAIDGSTDVKTTPWMKNDRECCIASQDTWEGANRRLEYSIPFKVPMLARATASCVETQEILQYDDRVIRVQTESRLPYIPFGEQFSTLCQICLLRDPSMTGNTRIKCFVEVLFRKTILWGNKIEAASVESADGFLKEFIRRLIEVPTEVLLPEDGEGAKSGMANMNVTQPELSTSPSSRSVMSAKQDGLPGMSPAHELLSQQYSKTLLVGTRRTRPSMDYVRPHSDSVLLSKTVTLDTVTVSGDLNITTAATVKPSKPAAAITAAAAVALWDQLVRKSIVIFAKLSVDSNQDSNAVKTGAAGPDNATQESVSKPAGDSSVDQSGEAGVADEDDKLAQDSAALSPSAEDARDLTAQPSKLSAEKTHVRGRILPRMVLVMLALGMTVFLVNVWRLFNVTSSMLHVVSMNQDHSRFLSSNGNSNVEGEALGSRFGGMLAIRQLQTQATLIPIQIQTEMLKAEISELVGLLEQARDVWQETQEQFPVREELSGGL